MTRLEELLTEFRAAMLIKFTMRHERAIHRWGSSVIDPDFDWDGLDVENIGVHLREEFTEWLMAEGQEKALEDVDLANMAFLDWVARRGDL